MELCATKFYPQESPLEGKHPIPKFTSLESSEPFESPQLVQASKASRTNDDEVKPTKLYFDKKDPSPKHKTTKEPQRWFCMAAGDSTDEDLADVSRRMKSSNSSKDATREVKVPKVQLSKEKPTVRFQETQASSNPDSSTSPPTLPFLQSS